MISIDYRSGEPIYDQIVGGILRLKAVGALSAGDKLPSVRALALEIGINPNTVQKAYGILESNGVIYSVAGKGSFISGDEAAMDMIVAAARTEFLQAVGRARTAGLSLEELHALVEEGGEKQ